MTNINIDIQNKLDILTPNSVQVNKNFILTLTKENKQPDEDSQKICRILKISYPEWKLEEISTTILELQAENYPNLFIFVIEVRNFGCLESEKEELTGCLLKFDKSRSMILQLTSKENNVTKIYYKEENCEVFHEVNRQTANYENRLNFPAFLHSYLNGEFRPFKNLMNEKWPSIQNSAIISKFLGILKINESFLKELLAATAGFFDENGELREDNLLSFLNSTMKINSFLKLAVKTSNYKIVKFLIEKCSTLIQQIPQKNQIQISKIAFSTNPIILYELLEDCDFPFPEHFDLESMDDERLFRTIKLRLDFHENVLAQNKDAIKEFTKINPNLKFVYNLENKSALSTALDSKAFNSFFLLKALRFQDNGIEDYSDRLDDKDDQKTAIRFASVQRRENVNISTADKDIPILMLATRSFIYNRSGDISEEEKQRDKIRQWYKEIYNSTFGCLLIDVASQCKDLKIIFDFECCSVENVDVSKNSSTTGICYRVTKWIFIGAKHEEDSKTIEQKIKGVISHELCHYVMGMVYQNDDNPYFKDDDKAKEELEKVVNEIEQMLFPPRPNQEAVDDEIENQSEQDAEEGDDSDDRDSDSMDEYIDDGFNDDEHIDECNGIISNVFYYYNPSVYHIEIIVRPVQMQAQFDHDDEKLQHLELRYKKLFKFFVDFVVPELKKFCLEQRKNVQTFNKITGLLGELKRSKIEFAGEGKEKDLSMIINNQLTIISTNIPKLLFLNTKYFLAKKYEDLMEVQNIFMSAQVLSNSYILRSFQEILQQESTLNVFVDCSNGVGKVVKKMIQSNNIKFFFVVQTEDDCKVLQCLSKKLEDKKLNPTKVTVDYNWMDLTPESQKKLLLQTKVDFQSNPSYSFFDLIESEIKEELENKQNYPDIVDNQLLKSLVEGSIVSINPQIEAEINDKHFKVLFQSRDVIKVEYEEVKVDDLGDIQNEVRGDSFLRKFLNIPKFVSSKIASHSSEDKTNNEVKFEEKTKKMTQVELLEDVKAKKFVLISDKAGSGKSWMLKNFANKLREKYPLKWITYVDLKQYIDKFKFIDIDNDFETFITKRILKPEPKYETEIFKCLYKYGKICIIFDGFDEIAPDCAELVTELFQSFKQNGSNQLWIATRDYFEVDLKEDLQLDVVYKLDEFTEEQGVNLIKFSWLLSEIEDKNENLPLKDLVEQIENSRNLKIYEKNAEKLSTKVPKAKSSSIGFPQFYKMIADVSKHNKNSKN